MNIRSLGLMLFIFAASAALAGYVGIKYSGPVSGQQAQPATPASALPSPWATGATSLSKPQISVVPQTPPREAEQPQTPPPVAETREPQQQVPPPAKSTMELSGTSTAEPPRTTGAREVEAAAKCNKEACANAYRSFDPADCTYMPAANSPRRICTKK